MKIAFYMTHLLTHGGGAEKYLVETAAALSNSAEIDIDIITLDRNFYRNFCKLLFFFYFRKIEPIERESESDIRKRLGKANWIPVKLKDLRNVLRQYDVIYTRNEIIDFVLMGNKNGLPPIISGIHTPIHFHSGENIQSKMHNVIYLGPIYKLLVKGVKAIHSVNQYDFDLCSRLFPNIKQYLIYYPFKSSETLPTNKDTEKFKIGFAARLSESKGVDILIGLIRSIATKHADIFNRTEFYIAGSGDPKFEEELKSIAKIYANVNYLGYISSHKMGDFYNNLNLVVIPSRFETVNYVALESGSAAVAAVASDIPGPREVIKNGETGFLLEPSGTKFEKKIVELIDLYYSDRPTFNKTGLKAREHIKEKFNPDTIYNKMLQMFKEIYSSSE